jgi:hypothetical protein
MARSPFVSVGRGALALAGLVTLLFGCGGGSGSPAGGSGGAPAGSGGATASGGTSGVGGASGGAASGTGGNSASGGASGTGGSTGSGGTNTGSGGGGGSGSSPGSGGAPNSGECTRELLNGTLDAYLAALAAHDASTLPLADGVKFTEDAQESEIGSGGLWLTAGTVKHTQRMVDLEECTVASHNVIPDGATDIPVAIRLKLEGGEIIEAEMIAPRPGDYTEVTSNTGEIIDMADDVGWDEPVPEEQQNTREELIAWMEKYFSFFPQGVCTVDDSCIRLENGGGSFDCDGFGAVCMAGTPGPSDNNLPTRLILADVEMGIGVGLTVYNNNTDMHMFKMIDGTVYGVQIILTGTNGETGWD